MAISSFRDLRVWQCSMDLVEVVYCLTQSFPSKETYRLVDQMCRAAISIPSNIAEGHAREHTKEFLNHISMAQGSLAELDTQAEIAVRLKYLDEDQYRGVKQLITSTSQQLYALRNSLQRRLKTMSSEP